MGAARLLLGLVAILLAPPSRAEEPSPPKTSVVVIVLDSLRADYLGSYGFNGDISPHLDRWAVESVVFEEAYAQAPWTKPSIATFFSSLEPVDHGVTTYRGQFGAVDAPPQADGKAPSQPDGKVPSDILPNPVLTLAESLQAAGYTTTAFVANPGIRGTVGFGQGFDLYRESLVAGTTGETMVGKARAWLEHRPAGKPFFLYLHLMDVHAPYVAPEEDFVAVKDSPSLGPELALTPEQLPASMLRSLSRAGGRWADPNREDRLQRRTWRGRYAAGVRSADRHLGSLLEYLRSSGLDAETLVVVMADHGEELFDHGGWSHGENLFEHQVHVPLIVRPPGGFAGGKKVKGFIGLIDIAPTILGQLALPPPSEWKGRNFASVLSGARKELGHYDAIFASGVKSRPKLVSARTRRYKLIRDRGTAKEELFNLDRDPGELNNGAARNSGFTAELRRRVERHFTRGGSAAASPKKR